MPIFCNPAKPTFKQRQTRRHLDSGRDMQAGHNGDTTDVRETHLLHHRLGIRPDMEINGWKWHNGEICAEMKQFRWETNGVGRVLTDITQHNQWPSVYHCTLKSMAPSKQCQAVCPFSGRKSPSCHSQHISLPGLLLDFLHICKRSLFALWVASLQLHSLDSVLPFSGLRAQNSASITKRCYLLKCNANTRKVQGT